MTLVEVPDSTDVWTPVGIAFFVQEVEVTGKEGKMIQPWETPLHPRLDFVEERGWGSPAAVENNSVHF